MAGWARTRLSRDGGGEGADRGRASWEDLAAVFGTADHPNRCQCQRYEVAGCSWRGSVQEQRTAMLRAQTACGDQGSPRAGSTPYAQGSRIRAAMLTLGNQVRPVG